MNTQNVLQSKKIIIFCSLFLTAFLFFVSAASAGDNFNPNLIISNEEMMDTTTMTKDDIQAFLEARGSYLAGYRTKNYRGEYKMASEIIYDAAANNYDCEGTDVNISDSYEKKAKYCRKVTINPRMLLVLLQKEQSLSEDPSPTKRQLDWATGYGCPDGQACNTRWEGFGKQVNSAALQFFDYLVNPHRYGFRAGLTYTITNTGRPSQQVTPANHATAALYNYTPHVYNGNYNFYKLWLKYFSFIYLDGSLLQAKGEDGVWLIQNGKKRPFTSRGALSSRFDANKILTVTKSDLENYPIGDPIKYAQYSLLRSPRGTIYLLVDDKRRGFNSAEAFRKVGYHPDEIVDASWEDINVYEEIAPITATTSFPMGALLQDKSTGGIYFVFEGTKAPLWDASLLKTKFKRQVIIQEDPAKLASYETVEPAIFSDGELLTSPTNPAVFVIAEKKKHPFISGKAFEELGYRWNNILTVPENILDLYALGEAILEIEEVPISTSTDEIASSSLEIIEESTPSWIPDFLSGSTTEEIMEYFDNKYAEEEAIKQ